MNKTHPSKKNPSKPIAKSEPQIKLPKGSLSSVLMKRMELEDKDFKPKIAVIGVGGGGGNAVNAVIEDNINDIVTIAYNTDTQALNFSNAQIKMTLGPKLTKGHGAGANPEIGKLAAQQSKQEIKNHLEGVHVAFIVAGMGGGTGTGAGPEIAKIAEELGILTIGLVTTPFEFEGEQRNKVAQIGLKEFQTSCDVLIVIANQNLFNIASEETTLLNAFQSTDNVLCKGLKSFIQTIKEPSRINVDIADFFTIMKGKKTRARMGTGFAQGENRAIKAAQEAMASPLLELNGMNYKDITGAIVCIRCGNDMKLADINQAVEHIRNLISDEAQIIFGATVDENMSNQVQISVFATSSIDYTSSYKKENTHYEIESSSFKDLLNTQETDFIGTPHSNMINEEKQQFKAEKELNLLEKIYNFFFTKSKKKTPPYID